MRIFASPSRYIQGENALFENAKQILQLGSHPVLLCDDVVYQIVGEKLMTTLLVMVFMCCMSLLTEKLQMLKLIGSLLWLKKTEQTWLLV